MTDEMTEEQLKKALSILGKKGGSKTKENYGMEHFRKLGRIGMAKRWKNHIRKTNIKDGPDLNF